MNAPLLDRFCRACGSVAPLELEVDHPDLQGPQLHSFVEPYVLIGRATTNHLCLRSAAISKRQVYLQRIEGRVLCMDIGSTSGIDAQGKQAGECWLDLGSELHLGPWTVRLRGGLQSSPPPGAMVEVGLPTGPLPVGQQLNPGVVLEISGQGQQASWRVDRVLTLTGSGLRCKMRLFHTAVSTFHCSFLHTPLGLWVIDLLSRTGTFLNGEPVRLALVADGDRLQVGPYLMRIIYDDPEALPPVTATAPVDVQTFHVPGTEAGEFPIASPSYLVPSRPRGEQLVGPDSLIPALLDKFNLLQQGMFDEFQQTTLMLVQMFGALHRDQMAAIRAELTHARELTAELRSLCREQSCRPHTPPAVPYEPAHQAPPTDSVRNFTEEAVSAEEPPPPVNGTKPEPARASPLPTPESVAGDATPDATIHAWLGKRLAALDAERQGRWQKILDFIRGK
jgi:pSer/pThr/pTyr-binding forkhead associated (FHA) protein